MGVLNPEPSRLPVGLLALPAPVERGDTARQGAGAVRFLLRDGFKAREEARRLGPPLPSLGFGGEPVERLGEEGTLLVFDDRFEVRSRLRRGQKARQRPAHGVGGKRGVGEKFRELRRRCRGIGGGEGAPLHEGGFRPRARRERGGVELAGGQGRCQEEAKEVQRDGTGSHGDNPNKAKLPGQGRRPGGAIAGAVHFPLPLRGGRDG